MAICCVGVSGLQSSGMRKELVVVVVVGYSFLECNNPFYYKSRALQTFIWISSEIMHFVRYLFQKSKQGVDS